MVHEIEAEIDQSGDIINASDFSIGLMALGQHMANFMGIFKPK
jgi:hypothetical protein